jgi:hypothetical protein
VLSNPIGQKIHPFVDLSIQPRKNLHGKPLSPFPKKRLPLILAVFCKLQMLLSF